MKLADRHIARVAFLVVALVAVTACGGGGSPPFSIGGTGTKDTGSSGGTGTSGGTALTPPPGNQAYSVGGTVSGLVGQGLTLSILNPANTAHHTVPLGVLAISHNGVYQASRVSDGYGVLVQDQPHSPTQRCVVRNPWGSFLMGPMADNVTDVDVMCGEFSFVTNAASDTISAFAVDAYTGAIVSAGAPVTAGSSPAAIASSPDKRYVYISNSVSNDVSVFAVDPGSGTLTALPGSPFVAGAKPQALSLYTAASQGYGPPLIMGFLYVANAGSDDLSAYWVDPRTGVPTRSSPASYATGPGPSVIAIDPSGPLLYTANTGGSGSISAFVIDTRSGDLTPTAGSPFPSGSSVSSLAFGTSNFQNTGFLGGNFLYAANASGSAAAILGFGVDLVTGALTNLAGFPFALPSCDRIVADGTGTYLYATIGANIVGYMIDRNTGALSTLAGFPVAVGSKMTSLSIDPTNQFLYVGNGSPGTVNGFELNAATGALTPIPGSPFAVGQSADFVTTL